MPGRSLSCVNSDGSHDALSAPARLLRTARLEKLRKRNQGALGFCSSANALNCGNGSEDRYDDRRQVKSQNTPLVNFEGGQCPQLAITSAQINTLQQPEDQRGAEIAASHAGTKAAVLSAARRRR